MHFYILLLFSGLYFDHPEIIPSGVQGDFRFSKIDERVSRFASKEAEVRALVEGQFMAKRIHAEQLGFKLGNADRLCRKKECLSNTFSFQLFRQRHAHSGLRWRIRQQGDSSSHC